MSKRIFDVTIALIVVCISWPLLIVIAVLVKWQLGSPVLFRQERPGLGGKIFAIVKFRTMLNPAASNGAAAPDSLRLTPFGKMLRRSSLDELPEVWNVLVGDMSLVGPRPLLPEYLPLYDERQNRRHEVRPGLTGWAQVNGRNAVDWPERFEMDVWYVENQSLWLDIKILWLTVVTVLSRRGVSAENHATMRPFLGNEDAQASAEGTQPS